MKKLNKGFTLIEILVVIGIIAILAAIVIVAINPARQFAQARNTQRESDVSTILNAIGQNMVDNKGVFGGGDCAGVTIPNKEPMDETVADGYYIGITATADVNLECLAPTYIASAIPFDPDGGGEDNTQYTVQVDDKGRYTVCAPNHAETAISGSDTYCLTR